jgi:hypothetical protein
MVTGTVLLTNKVARIPYFLTDRLQKMLNFLCVARLASLGSLAPARQGRTSAIFCARDFCSASPSINKFIGIFSITFCNL